MPDTTAHAPRARHVPPPPGAGERAVQALRGIALHFVAQLHARIELLQLDLASEKHRLQTFAVLCAGALMIGFLAAMLFVLLVVATTWDTSWRVPSIAIMAIVAAAAAGGIAARAYAHGRLITHPFAGTLEELRKDREALEDF